MSILATHQELHKKKIDKLAGYLKDAWIHAGITLLPNDEAFLRVARYLDNSGMMDDTFETPYLALRSAVDKALDVRDEAGNPLRDYRFHQAGFVSTLQETLLNGLADAENHF